MTSINKQKIQLSIAVLISLFLAYLISFLMLSGVDATINFYNVALMSLLIIFCSSSKKVFWWIIFPMVLVYAIYLPVGLTYGGLNTDFLLAGMSTDALETKEFLFQIPYENYFVLLSLVISILFFRFLIVKYQINFYRNKTFSCLSVIFILYTQAPGVFLQQIKTAFTNVYDEYAKLEAIRQESKWSNVHSTSEYDNYILVIGESARRDYHHAYGYPIENTPFMSSNKGLLVTGLQSGGSSTVASLKVMLTNSMIKDWNADYSLNIVNLAKEAGVETYWLSNQGYFGTHDTPISALANSSEYSFFTKYGEYSSKNTSDFLLVDKLKNLLDQNHNKKFVVLHLYGSHPGACDRVEDYNLLLNVQDPYYSYLNCYITSIKKTDEILSKIYNLLDEDKTKHNKSFSMVYFSDHGLAHRDINNVLYFNNNQLSKYHYEIPLFKISSDDTERKECQSFKSGLNFTNGIANWMGITADQLDSNYNLFDCKDDLNDFGLAEKIKEGVDDPAIDITGK